MNLPPDKPAKVYSPAGWLTFWGFLVGFAVAVVLSFMLPSRPSPPMPPDVCDTQMTEQQIVEILICLRDRRILTQAQLEDIMAREPRFGDCCVNPDLCPPGTCQACRKCVPPPVAEPVPDGTP